VAVNARACRWHLRPPAAQETDPPASAAGPRTRTPPYRPPERPGVPPSSSSLCPPLEESDLRRRPRGIINRVGRLWSRNWYGRGRFLDRRWPSRVWGRNPRCSRRRVRSWTLSMHSVETPACAGLIRLPSTVGNRLYDWATSCSTPAGSSASRAIRSCSSASSNSRVLIASVVAVPAKDRSRAASRQWW
jgi:hypothetical protein